jgi:6-phosphofructokinase 1
MSRGSIAVMTSGGDAPGMNAAVRAIVRKALAYDIQTYGVMRGYQGLIDGDIIEMSRRSVSGIIQHGGTVLKTSRCPAFKTEEGVEKAVEFLEKKGIEGLIVIGGDGSFHGAESIDKIWKGCVIGVPGTIDNDLYGTDETIGYDTAINTALSALDKIRDTADSHDMFFVVEVMGRDAGFIALDVGIAGGAEDILIPETFTDVETIGHHLNGFKKEGKHSMIIVIAEGDESGGAFSFAENLKKLSGLDYRVMILGHMQRGGSPTARDRVLATQLGSYAVDVFAKGKSGVAVGIVDNAFVTTELKETWSNKKKLNKYLLDLVPILR